MNTLEQHERRLWVSALHRLEPNLDATQVATRSNAYLAGRVDGLLGPVDGIRIRGVDQWRRTRATLDAERAKADPFAWIQRASDDSLARCVADAAKVGGPDADVLIQKCRAEQQARKAARLPDDSAGAVAALDATPAGLVCACTTPDDPRFPQCKCRYVSKETTTMTTPKLDSHQTAMARNRADLIAARENTEERRRNGFRTAGAHLDSKDKTAAAEGGDAIKGLGEMSNEQLKAHHASLMRESGPYAVKRRAAIRALLVTRSAGSGKTTRETEPDPDEHRAREARLDMSDARTELAKARAAREKRRNEGWKNPKGAA